MYSRIQERATRAVKWSVLAQWITRIIQFLLLLLMARTLTPSEYGIFEVTILTLALAQILQDFGLTRALIQIDSDETASANIVFWANFAFSLLIYSLLLLAAPAIARLFNEPLAAQVIRVSGLQLLILSFRSVHLGLAQRQLEFRRQFLPEFIGSIATVLSIAVFLYLDLRLWGFIYSLLFGAVIQTLVYWFISSWRPSLKIDIAIGRRLLGFGGLVAIEALQSWLLNYGDNLIIGHFLGLENLGIYALAFNLSVYSLSVALNPLSSVAYSSFSSLKSNIVEVERAFLNLIKLTSMIILPIVVGFAIIADLVAVTVLNDRWQGITPLIRLLVLFPGLSHILIFNPELYRAIGRPDIMPKLLTVTLLYSIPVYIFGTQFGLLGFTLARISITIIFFPVQVILISRLLKLKISQLWESIRSPLIATLVMALVLLGLLYASGIIDIWSGWLRLISLVIIAAGTYGLILWWIDKDLLLKIRALTKRAI
jgi:O-antigen/teichoic acid export membrane protein